MLRTRTMLAAMAALLLFFAGLAKDAWALPDQYMGDSSIYADTSMNVGRPNVLFIIDNSKATLNVASNVQYNSALTYPISAALAPNGDPLCPASTTDNPGRGCYQPWNVYEQDTQGDFSRKVFDNATIALEGLSCDSMPTDPADPIRQILQTYGTYSGSGVAPFPNLNDNGTCSYQANNASGKVYALGNYLNYLVAPAGDVVSGTPQAGCTPYAADVVKSLVCTERLGNGNCKNGATIAISYQCAVEHDPVAADRDANGRLNPAKWVDLGPTPAASLASTPTWRADYPGDAHTAALDGQYHDVESCGVTVGSGNATQRQVIWEALGDVIGYASTVVNFGAMVYGANNSGGDIIVQVQNLSRELGTTTTEAGNEVVIAPDCTLSTNATLPFCVFLNEIPGPGPDGIAGNADDGEAVLASETGRPQAESVFDAGYYFGAGSNDNYNPITLSENDPDDKLVEGEANFNPCGLNHIILLTNGFSNGDGSPNMAIVGDADGDAYGNEDVYGQGSHWLDDVARYLKVNIGATTHTVLAFQTTDDLVRNAARDGGGRFYNVFNRQQLAAALLDLLGSIVNQASTSFVAPVVPASTTNRTISSNRVYLGLFKPQNDGPWYGNIKKYGLNSDNRLTEPPESVSVINGDPATFPDGEFMTDSISFWSVQGGTIPSATGNIDPNSTVENARKGDGAEVAAGGIGGVLLRRMQSLSTAIKNSASTTGQTRDIFTFIDGTKIQLATSQFAAESARDPANVITAAQMDAKLGLPDTTLNWWDGGGTADGSDVSALTLAQADLLYHQNNLLRYLHGFDSLNVGIGESIWDTRAWILGDVLHSRPVVFNYTKYTHAEEGLCASAVEGGDYNSSIIFVGGNDGMFHAYRDCDGKELWAFVPDNVLGNLKYLPDTDGNTHTTFVDSPPAILFYDREEDGEVDVVNDKVIIIFGMRRGGGKNTLDGSSSRGAYYALDITDRANPDLLWKLDLAQYPQLAETWAIPVIKPIKVPGADEASPSDDIRYVAFIGAGYDQNEDLRYGSTQTFPNDTSGTTNLNLANKGGSVDGLDADGNPWITFSPGIDADGYEMRGRGVAAVLVAYLTSNGQTGDAHRYNIQIDPVADNNSAIGTVIWNYAPSSMKYSLATDLRALDLNNNGGYIDTIYAGDLGGNLWRFDTSDRTPSNWTGQIIFSSNYIDGTADSNPGRKIFYPPAVAANVAPSDTTYVCFGTGDREHPLNLAVVDRLYCIKDFGQTTVNEIDEADLVDVTNNELQLASNTTGVADILAELRSSPDNPNTHGTPDDTSDDTYTYGWYIRLNGTDRNEISGDRGEKELAEAVIFNSEIFFSTYQLKTGVRAGCEAGNLGISRLYRMDLVTGEATFNYDESNDTLTGADLSASDATVETGNDRAARLRPNVVVDPTAQLPTYRRADRVTILGEGIPSGIVQVVDAAGNVSLLISSSDKVQGIGGANPTSTFPVYWIQR